jgi:hypothetical protein
VRSALHPQAVARSTWGGVSRIRLLPQVMTPSCCFTSLADDLVRGRRDGASAAPPVIDCDWSRRSDRTDDLLITKQPGPEIPGDRAPLDGHWEFLDWRDLADAGVSSSPSTDFGSLEYLSPSR